MPHAQDTPPAEDVRLEPIAICGMGEYDHNPMSRLVY